ncbi:MAG: peptidylprolyl isomerase [Candidatus Margulisiibacteriota bacterium]
MLTWFRKKMKTIMIVVAILFGASMFYGLGYSGLSGGSEGGPGQGSRVIAKVNGQEIDPLRFREIMNRVVQGFGQEFTPSDLAFIENMALGQTIEFTLMASEASRKVKVSGREIDSALDGIMKQQKVASKRQLETALKQMGLTMGQFRDLIQDDLLIQKLQAKLREEVKVTPDDLREVRASHILLSTEAAAKTILAKLQAGGDFAALAKEYSLDKGSAAKGGDLGYFATGSMVKPFEQTAFLLKPGQLSGLVKTPFGYHIILLVDSRLRKFPANGQSIEQIALQEKQEKTFRNWYSEVTAKAKVEVISPEFKANNLRFKGQLGEAITEYKKAIAENPASPLLHVFLGDTFMTIGQKALAISEYESAVRLEGGNPDLYLVLGKAYEATGQGELAASQYKKASLVAGDTKAVHERLLKLFQKLKRPREVALEQSELKRIEKKEKFEKELRGGQ